MEKRDLCSAIEAAVEAVTGGNTKKRAELADLAGMSESSIRSIFGGCAPSAAKLDDLLRIINRHIVLGDPEGDPIIIAPAKRRQRSRG